jgi:isoleucyl-tRNA synthetase
MPVFKPVDTSMNFADAEQTILKFWHDFDIFHKSLKQRENVRDTKHWVFYEGPPTANGKPHPGHVLTRVVKDLFPRYKTMCGYYVPRKAGWDTHGLPVEIEVEKELKLNGKSEVEKYGVEPFVRKCMDSVFRYTTDWENLTNRIGFWIDLEDAYVTYHQSYVESVWWSLKELHGRGLLYKGHKILPWCPHCQTALSSHEVGLGYAEVEDPSVFVTFRDVDWDNNKTSFLAWTTTPWTLPSNAGLAVKADTEYSYVKLRSTGVPPVPGHERDARGTQGEETLIMASALVKQVMGKMKYEVVKTEPGSALVGRKYDPLFDWLASTREATLRYAIANYPEASEALRRLPRESPAEIMAELRRNLPNAWTVRAADFVTLDTGSGIVHMAPAFGADDYNLGKKEGLPVIQLVRPDGTFVEGCGPFSGRFVKDADPDLIRDLKARGLLLKRENYKHDYPFCWRCDNPLIYYARGGWFIATTREIQHIIENNKRVDWHPEHIRDGRFGSFLDSNIDWALSRERYWGTPLNIWLCECGNQESVASFEELKTKPGVKGLDAFDRAKAEDKTLNPHLRVHKPWIDAATFACSKCGKEMKRTPEVIDCWYDSGAMPFAQWGYPHVAGSKEALNFAFPADFISEAIDQTRGWFYSLIAESTLLNASFSREADQTRNQKPETRDFRAYPLPYKTCLVLGHVCDEKGEKMSKSKGNYLDPNVILDEEGADALRWFFYSGTNPWTSARFSRPAVREAQKEFLIKLRNVYSFFVIYANIDGFDPGGAGVPAGRHGGRPHQKTLLDRWILSELHQTVRAVRKHLDDYDIFAAAQDLNTFVESLSNWYVRRSRDRFWSSWQTPDKSSAHDQEKLSAFWTLYESLLTVAQLAAPFVPFMTEEIWQNLSRAPLGDQVPESVHLCDYPQADESLIDLQLAEEIALVREVASLGRAARAGAKLKTRQPLLKAIVVAAAGPIQKAIKMHEQVLLDELNVHEIEFAVDRSQYVHTKYVPNFKAIGAKYRSDVPGIKQALASGTYTLIKREAILTASLQPTNELSITLPNGKSIMLSPEEYEENLMPIEGYAAASGRTVVVVLDTHLTPELQEEGIARELVNRINGWRGDLNLAYEQRVRLAIKGSAKLEDVARKHDPFIREQAVALEQKIGELPPGWKTLEIEVDGEKATLGLMEA